MVSKNPQQAGFDRNLQHLYTEIAKLITSSLEVSEVIDAIMNEVKNYFRPRNWSLLRLDSTTHKLFFVVCDGIDQEIVKHIHLNIGEGIAGYVAKTGKSRIVDNVNEDPYFSSLVDKLTGFSTLSIIAVPIMFQQQVLGVIELVNTLESQPFTESDLKILETIADFAAIALTNAMRYEYMSSIAISDPLTGLYNRARLDKLIATSSKPASLTNKDSEGARLIVACVDVNNMKYVNDNYGHRVGDDVLIKTARLLQSCCNEKDLAFRTGGDEFLVVFVDVDKEAEAARLNYLHDQLEVYSKPVEPSQGFSFGIVSGRSREIVSLIANADNEMYKNKKGR